MKYFETLIEDQETTISILYEEQVIKIYSSVPETIRKLTKVIGQPNMKYKKSKTYWSGASWTIGFFELEKIKEVLTRDIFIDKKTKPRVIKKKEKKVTNKNEKKIISKKENRITNKKESKFEQIQLSIL